MHKLLNLSVSQIFIFYGEWLEIILHNEGNVGLNYQYP